MKLANTVAIVTGGGTGIGQAVCIALAEAGARAVVVNYSRSAHAADATAQALAERGCEGFAYQTNVASDPECRTMIAEAVSRFGRLDVVVNNAATTRVISRSDLASITEEVWDAILDVNLKGAFYCSRAAAPELRKAGGSIVNIGSVAGIRASGSSIPYGVSKAALLHLTRHLARALAPEIRVNSVSPGLVSTQWFRHILGDEATNVMEHTAARAAPLAAVATAKDVAQVVLAFLGLDLVTGENLVVDGGLHITY